MYVCMYVRKGRGWVGDGKTGRGGGGRGRRGRRSFTYPIHMCIGLPQTDRQTDRWTMSVVGCIFKTTPGAYIAHMDKYVGR